MRPPYIVPGAGLGLAVGAAPALFVQPLPVGGERWRGPDGFTVLEELRSYLDSLESFGNLVEDDQATLALQAGSAAGFFGDALGTGERWLYLQSSAVVAFVCNLGLACDTPAELHCGVLPELVSLGVLHQEVHRLHVLGLGQVLFYAFRCAALWSSASVGLPSKD